jgi:hypothetical protein
MAFKKVIAGDTNFIKLAETPAGAVFEGSLVKVLTGEYGPTYILETEDGQIGIPGKTRLNILMEKVAPGSLVRITYDGLKKNTSGKFKGKDAHNFSVEVDAAQEADLSKVS